MATTVGFISEKGGVGKTTACYHLAVALSGFEKKRVLVVDTDYQRGGITCRMFPSLIEGFREGKTSTVTLFNQFQGLYSATALTTSIEILKTPIGWWTSSLIPADPRLAHVTVEKIPATICARCGEPVFSRETTEKVRRMVHGQAKPVRSVPLEVFAFS